jgi:protein-tyrosine phosphatase
MSAGDPQLQFLEDMREDGVAYWGNTPFACPIVSHIEDNLWVGGSYPSPLPKTFRCVVNLYGREAYGHQRDVLAIDAPIPDGEIESEDFLYGLAAVVNTMRSIGPTLVHCQAGLNRSALVVGLTLVRAGRSPDEVITLMRERRSPAVLCNPHFEAWLREQA